MFDNIEPDTDQDRRFMSRILRIFSGLSDSDRKRGLEVGNAFFDAFCEDREDFEIIHFSPTDNIQDSYEQLLQLEKQTGNRLPIVKLIENIISDSSDPNMLHFKNIYFQAKEKYIKYEESEDINNF